MSRSSNISKNNHILTVLVCIIVPLFILLNILGNYGPDLMANGICYQYLGCNTGVFGFDALVHFFSGITDVLVILWVMRTFPSTQLLRSTFWKNILILLSLVLLIGFIWEFAEFCSDQYHMWVLHMQLSSPDRLDQASIADTMGDLLASLVGALLTAPWFLRTKK